MQTCCLQGPVHRKASTEGICTSSAVCFLVRPGCLTTLRTFLRSCMGFFQRAGHPEKQQPENIADNIFRKRSGVPPGNAALGNSGDPEQSGPAAENPRHPLRPPLGRQRLGCAIKPREHTGNMGRRRQQLCYRLTTKRGRNTLGQKSWNTLKSQEMFLYGKKWSTFLCIRRRAVFFMSLLFPKIYGRGPDRFLKSAL